MNSASIFLIALAMSSTIAQRAWGYEVKGTLTTAAAAIPTGSLDYSFRARVDGRGWSIRVEPLATASGVKYHEDAFDGTYSYHYVQMARNPAFQAINTSFGVIDTNSLPCEGSPLAPGIWLAYCSAQYFHGPSAGMIREIFDSGFETSALSTTKRRAVYELHPDAPRLPRSVCFLSDGTSHWREADEVKTQRFPHPFDQGYIAQRFTANAFTNAGGLWFPSSFTLEFLSPNIGKATSSNDVSAIVTWKGVLNSVDPTWTGALADFVPVTDGATSTEDRRFPPLNSEGERVSYVNTNAGRWVPLANQRLQGIQQAFIRNDTALKQAHKAPGHPVGKILLGAAAAVLLLLPIITHRCFRARDTTKR